MSSTMLSLLGTAGGPGGHVDRAGIASLVTVGGRRYLIDAGEGVSRQLARAGTEVRDIDGVFLTHLHDDHTAGLPGFVTFRHTMRGGSLPLIGPPGARALCAGILAYLDVNFRIRGAEAAMPSPEGILDATEVEPGIIYSDDDVRVTAVKNTHYALTEFDGSHRSYSLRFDAPDRSIVFTGDTGVSPAVEQLARGADILVSEMVTDADTAAVPPFVRAHMAKEHLSPTQVGQLAATAGVGCVVLSHYTQASAGDLAQIRGEFSGEVIAGEDLMQL
jgi:ribonuclease BN (tRNA processing enzyme)